MRLACRGIVLTRSSARVTSARPGDAAMELNRTCACCTIATFFAWKRIIAE